jgi:uncharacterized protein
MLSASELRRPQKGPSMAAKFEIKPTRNGQFCFRLRAGNGEIILASETYSHLEAAKNGVSAVKTNADYDSRYERKTGNAGEAYFVMKAPNQEIIGKSEMYSSTAAMENGIKSLKKIAPTAKVVVISEANA